ncbi:MAG: TIGR01212 family radical SAM protein [Lachnospirales bacterium]
MIELNSKHPFYSANDFYKEIFGEKIVKLAIDGGFTCPNRDGKLSNKGCIFCSNKGSGDFAADRNKSISEQYYEMTEKMKGKWKSEKYMMYFQAFTNTYAPIDKLYNIYNTAIALPNVVALAIGTRPDCIDDSVLKLLCELNKKVFLQVELGLQTTNEDSVKLINRCYDNSVYERTVKKLKECGINVVTHIILGLPNENYGDMLESVNFALNSGTDGLKLQLLHILKSTGLYKLYLEKPFKIFTYEEYIDTIIRLIENIPKNIVIHRITGDANKSDMFKPWWSLDKRRVLNGISKEFILRNTHQGANVK